MKSIRTFYLTEGGNWGDVITPFLFKNLYNIETEQTTRDEPFELVCCGSLIRDLPNPYHENPKFRNVRYTGHVLGTGLMDWTHREPFDLSQAQVHLLRGKLTRDHCKLVNDPPLGDPGILAYLFAPSPRPQPEFEIGIIPHMVEKNDQQVADWQRQGAHIIDVCSGVQKVINEACRCKKIVSSSLHGLVLADSLGIPNHAVVLNDPRIWVNTGGFKFHDYYSVYGEKAAGVQRIDKALRLCKTRDTTEVKAIVKQAFDNFVQRVKC